MSPRPHLSWQLMSFKTKQVLHSRSSPPSLSSQFRAMFVDELARGVHLSSTCFAVTYVWDLREARKVMPQNTVFITLLRDQLRPLSQSWVLHLDRPSILIARQAAANEGKSALSVFWTSPEIFWDPKEPGNGLAKNPMSFDMGLNNQKWNGSGRRTWSKNFTWWWSQNTLMSPWFSWGALLGLEHDDLVYLRSMLVPATAWRSWTKHASENAIMERTGHAALNDFLCRCSGRRAAQFGMERLKKAEVERLSTFTEDTRRKCVSRAEVPPWELEDLLRPWQTRRLLSWDMRAGEPVAAGSGFCIRMMLPELQYHSHLYFKQYGRDMRAAPAEWNLGPVDSHHLMPGLGYGYPSTFHRAICGVELKWSIAPSNASPGSKQPKTLLPQTVCILGSQTMSWEPQTIHILDCSLIWTGVLLTNGCFH